MQPMQQLTVVLTYQNAPKVYEAPTIDVEVIEDRLVVALKSDDKTVGFYITNAGQWLSYEWIAEA